MCRSLVILASSTGSWHRGRKLIWWCNNLVFPWAPFDWQTFYKWWLAVTFSTCCKALESCRSSKLCWGESRITDPFWQLAMKTCCFFSAEQTQQGDGEGCVMIGFLGEKMTLFSRGWPSQNVHSLQGHYINGLMFSSLLWSWFMVCPRILKSLTLLIFEPLIVSGWVW